MELSTFDYTTDYKAFKQELDTELGKAADGFVKIGYLLKLARDTDILAESGYTSIADFAKAEYGLTKDVVSRYININDRYSEGGNSPCLADRYKGFGVAKLAEMLTLPDAIVDNISADTTKEEIKVIKKEYAEEQEISDIEVALEAAEVEANAPADHEDFAQTNNMEKLIYDFMRENPEEYIKFDGMGESDVNPSMVADILAPSGSKTIIGRVPGVGRLIMTIKDCDTDIVVTNMRSGEVEYYKWSELCSFLYVISCPVSQSHEEWWPKVFKEPWTYETVKETEVPKGTTSNTIPKTKPTDKPKKKGSKVTVIKKDKPAVKKPEPVVEKVEVVPGVEAEIIDINKATETAVQEEIKAEIEAVPSHTVEELEENPEVAPVQPSSYSFYKEMPKDKLLKVFEELYNQMDEEYQGMKKYLRQYNSEGAVALMNTCNELHTKLIDIADVLNEMEDESND